MNAYSKTLFGFWVYLMTDFMVFATLFATYAVLHRNTFGGPGASDLFHLPYTLVQTLLFLFASLAAGFGGIYAHKKVRSKTVIFFILTFLLGLAFVWMQFGEFGRILASGHDWQESAFLSIYFTLVGTHTFHVLFALLWVIVLLPLVWKNGLDAASVRRLSCLRIFWQFLNVVWIFIFTVVYLMGVS